MKRLSLLAVCCLLLVSCGGETTATTGEALNSDATTNSSPPPTTTPPTTTTYTATPAPAIEMMLDVPFAWTPYPTYTAEWNLDLYTPLQPGDLPVFLFLPGYQQSRGGYSDLAEAVVEKGAIAAIVEYPPRMKATAVVEDGRGYREVAEVLSCAIRYARFAAAARGSSTPSLVIGGISLGGGPAAHVALAGDALDDIWTEFSETKGGLERQVECEVDEGSTHVDGFVGIAGTYDIFVGYEGGAYGREFIEEIDTDVWSTLFGTIGRNPDVEVRLLHGDADTVVPIIESNLFRDALSEAGIDVELTVFEGGHVVPLEQTVSLVMELLNG